LSPGAELGKRPLERSCFLDYSFDEDEQDRPALPALLERRSKEP
jgi:hypothetical protein